MPERAGQRLLRWPGLIDIAGDFRGRIRADLDSSSPGQLIGLFKVRGSLLPLTRVINGNDVTFHALELKAGGLVGQVIVNAEHDSESWTSTARVGSTILSHSGGVYSTPSASLGGGAVGLAPFPFYPVDCTPPHNQVGPNDGVLTSDFLDDENATVFLRWTGPIMLPSGFTDAEGILDIHVLNPNLSCDWMDMTGMFTPILHPGGDARALGLAGHAGAMPKDGIYRVTYIDPDVRFRCAEVEGFPMVGAFPAGGCEEAGGNYLFQMLPDCQPNGIADHIDVDPIEGESDDLNENGIPDECEGFDPCSCDWDDDGMVEVEDIFDFLTDWFANDPDALNYGGTSGVAAIFAFLTCWFAAQITGPCDP